jgi:hypothetical protein
MPIGSISDFPKFRLTLKVETGISSFGLVPHKGRIAIVTDAGRDAVDAGGATDESACLADGEAVWS